MISANLKAFLDMIAWSEIGPQVLAGSDNGYNVLVGSTPTHILTFPSYAAHPNILNEKLNSTAAGRYQILHRYFIVYQQRLHLPDFSPANQDAAAIQQITESHAIATIDAGDIVTAIGQCSHIWASLPGNTYGQRTNTLTDLQDAFTGAGGILTS